MTVERENDTHGGAFARSAGAAIVVCEADGTWAALLRRELGDDSHALRETRSPAECVEVAANSAGGVVVCELDENRIDDTLALLLEIAIRFPAYRVVIVAKREFAYLEPLVRELGAIYMITSPRQLRAVVDLTRRHLARVELPSQTITERVWDNLPWRAAASGRQG